MKNKLIALAASLMLVLFPQLGLTAENAGDDGKGKEKEQASGSESTGGAAGSGAAASAAGGVSLGTVAAIAAIAAAAAIVCFESPSNNPLLVSHPFFVTQRVLFV